MRGAFADGLVESIGLGGREFAHREVVQNEQGGPGELTQPVIRGAIGIAPARMAGSQLGVAA